MKGNMKTLKSYIFSEKKLAGLIFGFMAIAAFSFIFGPNIYAQFARQTGDAGWGYGYGYGYGYGGGFDGGTYAGYRVDGDPDPTVNEYGYGYGYIASGVTYDTENGYEVTPSNLSSLVQGGVIVPDGADITSTTEIAFANKVTMTAGNLITVTIPSGTTFTAATAGDFSALAATTNVSVADLTGGLIAGRLDFGLPNLGITVDPAITISVNVGTVYNGLTLNIYRKDAGGAWVRGPAGTSATCVVTAGVCAFTTTHLSSFAAVSPTSNQTGVGGSTGGSGGSGTGTYSNVTADATVSGTYSAATATANNPDFNTNRGLTAVTGAACVSGTLIKNTSLPAVYYCGADGKRYVFVNDKVYFSWYKDFSGVRIISDATLASIMIGGNITYRPGVKMVKIVSDPKVYAVARGGVLRWIQTEAIAQRLYGTNWNKMIDDVSDSFFVNYVVGSPISN